jgi:hypothetical protein
VRSLKNRTEAMHSDDSPDHGRGLTLARSELGAVSVCPCGVVTLTVQYLSLRFEPGAFRELQALLAQAQRRIDGSAAAASSPGPLPGGTPPMH